MTTIAYRDGVLAADTLHSSDGIVISHRSKLEVLENGGWLATKGCSGFGRALRQWLEGGRIGDQPKGDGGGILVHPDGALEAFEDGFCEHLEGAPYFAFGSGQQIALGAMFAGATAEQAIAAAINHDVYTGGEVIALRRQQTESAAQ